MRASSTADRPVRPLVAAIMLGAISAISGTPALAQAPEPLPPARELIAKFVAATNSPAALAKHSSVRTKGRFEMAAAGVTGDLEISQARPNKSMMRINLPGMGEIVRGFDGTNGWSLNPMEGPRLLSGRELEQMREESTFGESSRQGPNVASAETVEKTTMNGEACYKVKVLWKSGRESFDCYSAATGLLIASVGKQETPMGTVEVTNLIGDYKDFGGLKVATRLTQQVMGQEQVMTFSTVDYDVADATTFEMPASIKALTEKKP
jgi:hypothetical protein